MDAATSTTRRGASRGPSPAVEPAPVRQQQLLEAFSAYCQACLYKEAGTAAREFLIRYGFPAERLESTPIGVFPAADEVREHLRAMGFAAGELRWFGQAMNELSPGWLVGPVHDPTGKLVTFYACETAPNGKGAAQYLFLRTGADVPAIGLDVALSSDVAAADNLVLVENLLDVLLLHSLGLKNVAGICDASRQFSSRRWDALGKLGVRQATLAFNPIEPPYAFIQASIDEALRSRHAPAVWLIEPGEFAGANDAADWLREHGPAAWPGLMERRIHALHWKARNLIISNWGVDGLDETRAAALQADAEAFDRSIRREPVRAELERQFWPVIRAALQPPPTAAPPAEKHFTPLAPMPAPADPLPPVSSSSNPPPPATKPSPPPVAVREQPKVARPKVERPRTSDFIPSVADDLDEHQRGLRDRRGRAPIGMNQLALPSLDRATSGLRGLTVLAGRPRTGKSALALQWAWDVLGADPHACALFVSLKAPRREILTRLQSRLAGLPWRVLVRGSSHEGLGGVLGRESGSDSRFSDEERTRIRKSESLLAGRGKRISVLDEASRGGVAFEAICDALESLRTRTEARRCLVAIDCAELWDAAIRADGQSHDTAGELSRWRTVRRLRDALGPDDALLAVSEQVGRESPCGMDVSSFGAAAYLADVLLWLNSPDSDARGLEHEAVARQLHVLGGPDDPPSGAIALSYRPAIGDFVEIEPPDFQAPRAVQPPPAQAEVALDHRSAITDGSAREAAVDRRGRFTWGPYGADST